MAKEPREQQETGELDADRLNQREPLEADAGDDDIDDEVDDEVDDAEDDEQPV